MARNTKVQKIGDAKLNECEQAIGYALMELESNSDLKAQLRELFIRSAQEIEIGKGKKAIVVFVPVPQLKAFQKIQLRLVYKPENSGLGPFFSLHSFFLKTNDTYRSGEFWCDIVDEAVVSGILRRPEPEAGREDSDA